MTNPLAAPQQAAAIPPLVRPLLAAILLLAFGLRAFGLDSQSFWSDEGISLARVALPVDDLLAAMPVEHAPGYFVGLHGWRAVTGEADFGLRYFSLLPGVLAVALLARLGHDLAQPWGGRHALALTAAALAATSVFQISYAQEARMYTWLLAASLAATWALWRILTNARRRVWAAALYAVATAACVYLHYYGALVPIAHAVYVAGWALLRRDGRALRAWLAGAAAAFLLFLPWLPRATGIFGFEGWREPGSPAEIPLRYLRAFSLSEAMPAALARWLLPVYAGLLLLGLIWWLARRREAGALLAAMLAVPLAGVLLLALRSPDYHERYSIALAGPLVLLVAGGVSALGPGAWGRARRREWLAPAAAAVLLVLLNGAAIWRYTTDATLHKPDYRAAAARIEAEQQPGDVILVDGPDPELVFGHYYDGGLPMHDLRGLEDWTLEEVAPRVESAVAGARRAWELLYFHDPAAVQVWLATQAWATEPTYHNNIRVTLYALDQGESDARALDLAYGEWLTLRAATVAPARVAHGDILRVTTDWFTRSAPPDFKFSLRLVDASGAVALTQDYVPQNWFAPTNVWIVGQPARDQRGILIPPELAPGRYTVTLRLYDAATGAALSTSAGEDVELAAIEVEP